MRLIKLLGQRGHRERSSCAAYQRPGLPTGGQILNSVEEMKQIYKTGSGAIRPSRHVGHRSRDSIDQDRSTSKAFPIP